MTEVRRKPAPPIRQGAIRQAPDWTQSAILGDRGAAARHFADLVAERFTGSVLSFSQRKALLVHAMARGIGRFEANLIIAAVQHRMRAEKPDPRPMPRPSRRFPLGIATFLTVQTLIGIAIWRLFG